MNDCFSALIALRNRVKAEKEAKEKAEEEERNKTEARKEAESAAREVIDDLLSRLAPAPEKGFICQTVDEVSSEDSYSARSSQTEISESESVIGKQLEEDEPDAGNDINVEEELAKYTRKRQLSSEGSSKGEESVGNLVTAEDAPSDLVNDHPVESQVEKGKIDGNLEIEKEPLKISSVFYNEQVEKVERDFGGSDSTSGGFRFNNSDDGTTPKSSFDRYLSTLEKTLEELNNIEREKMNRIADRMDAARQSLQSDDEDFDGDEEDDEEEFLSATFCSCPFKENGEDDDECESNHPECYIDDDQEELEEDDFEEASEFDQSDHLHMSNGNEILWRCYPGSLNESEDTPVDSQAEEEDDQDRSFIPAGLAEDIRTILRHDLSVIEAINMDRVMESIPRLEDPESLIINDVQVRAEVATVFSDGICEEDVSQEDNNSGGDGRVEDDI